MISGENFCVHRVDKSYPDIDILSWNVFSLPERLYQNTNRLKNRDSTRWTQRFSLVSFITRSHDMISGENFCVHRVDKGYPDIDILSWNTFSLPERLTKIQIA